MNSCKRMQPVAAMAQQQVDAAAQSVSECNRAYATMRKQLDELLSYRDDYANGLHHKSHQSFNALQIKDYRLFMERLNKAIEQQQDILNSAGVRLAASKQVWLAKQQRAKAIDAVMNRYHQVERRERSRRERYEGDEHAQHFLRRQGN